MNTTYQVLPTQEELVHHNKLRHRHEEIKKYLYRGFHSTGFTRIVTYKYHFALKTSWLEHKIVKKDYQR